MVRLSNHGSPRHHGARDDGPSGSERPLWLFLSEPGLGPLLEKELTHRKILKAKTRAARLHLRNYDLVVVPDVQLLTHKIASRLALDALVCPVFGRSAITEALLDRLELHWRAERTDGITSSAVGAVFDRPRIMRWLARRLEARAVDLSDEPKRPARLLIVDDKFYFCFPRFNHHEVRDRRSDALRSGSLPPTIAAAMCFAAKLGPREVIWDPVCGTGTLLREALALAPDATLIGSDVDGGALTHARVGLGGARLIEADSRALDLGVAQITLGLGNLPFGRQFASPAETHALYEGILRNAVAHGAANWRGCFLTSDEAALHAACLALGLAMTHAAGVKVRGTDAAIWLVARPAGRRASRLQKIFRAKR
jgi:RMKL-like, methyltransferase domain